MHMASYFSSRCKCFLGKGSCLTHLGNPDAQWWLYWKPRSICKLNDVWTETQPGTVSLLPWFYFSYIVQRNCQLFVCVSLLCEMGRSWWFLKIILLVHPPASVLWCCHAVPEFHLPCCSSGLPESPLLLPFGSFCSQRKTKVSQRTFVWKEFHVGDSANSVECSRKGTFF